jgi:hypothetical protein
MGSSDTRCTNRSRITKNIFPKSRTTRGLHLYDKEKELELQTEHDESWFKKYKKTRTYSGDSRCLYVNQTGERIDGRICATVYERYIV